MALLYADENFPRPTVVELRSLSHDVLTAHEAGQANRGIEDAAVLEHATQLGRCVLTQNRKHFRSLHLNDDLHAGIVICTVDPDFARLANRVHEALSHIDDPAGKLVSVVRPSI